LNEPRPAFSSFDEALDLFRLIPMTLRTRDLGVEEMTDERLAALTEDSMLVWLWRVDRLLDPPLLSVTLLWWSTFKTPKKKNHFKVRALYAR
jgi:hypothetical protein